MNMKKVTKKDRYGNQVSYEFEVPEKPLDPTTIITKQMELDAEMQVPEMMMMTMESMIPPVMGEEFNMGDPMNHPGEPMGSDTVPAWLTPGEFVVNKEATEMFGPEIEAMNEVGKMMKGGMVDGYNRGGSVRGSAAQIMAGKDPADIVRMLGTLGNAYQYVAPALGLNEGGDIPMPVSMQDALLHSREGFRDDVYLDSLGKPTVGAGHLLGDEWKSRVGEKPFSRSQLDEMFEADRDKAVAEARSNVGEEAWNKLNKRQQATMASMAFQLGGAGQRKFKNLLNAVKAGDNREVAKQALTGSKGGRSLWLKQTPVRALDLAEAFDPEIAAQYRMAGGQVYDDSEQVRYAFLGGLFGPSASEVNYGSPEQAVFADLLKQGYTQDQINAFIAGGVDPALLAQNTDILTEQQAPAEAAYEAPDEASLGGSLWDTLMMSGDDFVPAVAGALGVDEDVPEIGEVVIDPETEQGQTYLDKLAEDIEELDDEGSPWIPDIIEDAWETDIRDTDLGAAAQDKNDADAATEEARKNLEENKTDPAALQAFREAEAESLRAHERYKAEQERVNAQAEADKQQEKDADAALKGKTTPTEKKDQIQKVADLQSMLDAQEAEYYAAAGIDPNTRERSTAAAEGVFQAAKKIDEREAAEAAAAEMADSGVSETEYTDLVRGKLTETLGPEIGNALGSLFDAGELAKMMVYAGGAMIMGQPPMAALNFGLQKYLGGLDSKAAAKAADQKTRNQQALQILQTNKYTPASIEEWKKTGNMNALKPLNPTAPVKPGKITGTKVVVPGGGLRQVWETGSGVQYYKDAQGNEIPLEGSNARTYDAATMGEPAVKEEFSRWISDEVGSLNEGVSQGDEGYVNVNATQLSNKANQAFQKMIRSSRVPVDDAESLKGNIGAAINDYLAAQKAYAAGELDKEPVSLDAFIDARVVSKITGISPAHLEGVTVESQYKLNSRIRNELRADGVAEDQMPFKYQQWWQAAQAAWAGVPPKDREKFQKRALKGENGFTIFMTDLVSDKEDALKYLP